MIPSIKDQFNLPEKMGRDIGGIAVAIAETAVVSVLQGAKDGRRNQGLKDCLRRFYNLGSSPHEAIDGVACLSGVAKDNIFAWYMKGEIPRDAVIPAMRYIDAAEKDEFPTPISFAAGVIAKVCKTADSVISKIPPSVLMDYSVVLLQHLR